jgi:peptidoglycan/xylan/chitin deacetylase (PgdA/CDA1 family)
MLLLQIIFQFLFAPGPQETSNANSDLSRPDSKTMMQTGYDVYVDTLFTGMAQSIRVKGKGQNNNLLGLWHNGKYAASAIINKGNYEFPAQSLYIGANEFLIWSLSDKGTTTLVDSFSINYFSQRLHLLSIPFSRLKTKEKILALTFDAGSAANGADSIINILEENDLELTFFLTGTFIQKFPEIVESLISNGHEMANHSYSHPHLTSYSVNQLHNNLLNINRQFIYDQLNKTDSLFNERFGQHLKPYWRAPYGEYNDQILMWAAELGYKHIGWSAQCDTRDWISDKDSDLYWTAEEIYQHLIDLESRGKLTGAVILMHVHTERNEDQPYKILPKLIQTLKQRGYKIVSISTLLTSAIAS